MHTHTHSCVRLCRYAATATERLTALCISPPPRFKAQRRMCESGAMQRTMIGAAPAGALRAGLRIVCLETGAKSDADLRSSHIAEVAGGARMASIFDTMWKAGRKFGVRRPNDATGDSSGDTGSSGNDGGAGGGGVHSPDKGTLHSKDMREATASTQE